MKDNNFPKLMGTGDVLSKLGISQSYLQELVKKNKIRHQRISSGLVFLEEDIEEFDRNRRGKAKTDPRIKIRE